MDLLTRRLQAGVTNSDAQYEWAISATLGDLATYGFRIELESNSSCFQWSNPFEIDGSANSSGSKPSATTDGTTAAPTHSSSSTAPPKAAPTRTSVEEPTEEPEQPEQPEPEEPASGAAATGVMGTAALVGAIAAAVFAF